VPLRCPDRRADRGEIGIGVTFPEKFVREWETVKSGTTACLDQDADDPLLMEMFTPSALEASMRVVTLLKRKIGSRKSLKSHAWYIWY